LLTKLQPLAAKRLRAKASAVFHRKSRALSRAPTNPHPPAAVPAIRAAQSAINNPQSTIRNPQSAVCPWYTPSITTEKSPGR
jgi:hypothetical protein